MRKRVWQIHLYAYISTYEYYIYNTYINDLMQWDILNIITTYVNVIQQIVTCTELQIQELLNIEEWRCIFSIPKLKVLNPEKLRFIKVFPFSFRNQIKLKNSFSGSRNPENVKLTNYTKSFFPVIRNFDFEFQIMLLIHTYVHINLA